MSEYHEMSDNAVKNLLLNKSRDSLSDKFINALTCLFKRYTEGNADGEGMSVTQLQAFSRACNAGKPFTEDEIEQIQTYFQTDGNKGLTLNGWLDMYSTQTIAAPRETWNDMIAQGYAKALVEAKDTEANKAGTKCGVCKKIAVTSCGGCKLATYCGKPCQKKDWKNGHKAKCGSQA